MQKKVEKPRIIVIQGATSTGKSDFAVLIAKEIGGEIISADSRQVYRGMDIGTGKITKKEMSDVPHHMLDIVSPNTDFSVSKYKKLADKKIKEILNRGNVPIICGGTGFYIDAVVDNIILPQVVPDKKLRAKLEKEPISTLFKMLKKLDSDRAENIDKNNKVRLIRAIEIAKALGKVPLLPKPLGFGNYEVMRITLNLPDEILKEKIYERILIRIKGGMMKEFEKLHAKGLAYKKMETFGLEYKYGAQYLKGEISKEEFIEKLNKDTWQYAKRQRTWFKRNPGIYLDPRDKKALRKIQKEIKKFLTD